MSWLAGSVSEDEDTLDSYGQSLDALGRTEEAKAKFRAALKVNEKSVSANDCLGLIYSQEGNDAEALACWQAALRADPKNVAMANKVAGLLASSTVDAVRNGKEAVRVAEQIVNITAGKDPVAFDTLAAAEAERGHFQEAVRNARKALAMVAGRGDEALVAQFQQRLKLYEQGKPCRRTPAAKKSTAKTSAAKASR